MARQRSHSIEFKRQVAQEFVAGETLYALAKRYDVSRNLIRVWVKKLETGVFDDDANAADLLVEYEAKIAALERMVGRQALEIEFLKGALIAFSQLSGSLRSSTALRSSVFEFARELVCDTQPIQSRRCKNSFSATATTCESRLKRVSR